MYNECRYVLPSGLKCTDPLLQHSQFCYQHRNFHEQMYAVPPRPGTPFRLPSLEDACGCRFALQQVCWAMGDKRIPPNEAGIYLRAVGLAMRLFPRRPRVSRKPVRALNYDDSGMEMAEPSSACEPPRDCMTCQNHCHWFKYYEDQVEDIEDQMAEEEEQKKLAAQKEQQQPPTADQAAAGTATTDQSNAERVAAEQPTRKYDNELPNVRALLLDMDRKAEQEQKVEAERLARIEANKRIFDNHPLPARPKAS
jgi:hypothetical protein